MKILPYGPRALLVQYADRADEAAFRWGRQIESSWTAEFGARSASCLPGLTSLVWVGSPEMLQEVRDWLAARRWEGLREESEPERVVEVPTQYAGPDLERVAAQAGLPIREVIERHAAPLYRVHCLGFSPGFPYLGGMDPRLTTPRLASPRIRVEAGSVAIGGTQTGIYSVAGPGGWNLIGQTSVHLFRPQAASVGESVLLCPGDRLRFIPVDRLAAGVAAGLHQISHPIGVEAGGVEILSTGVGLTVQDAGRPGLSRYGIPPGGAMDPGAARWANRLVGNPEEAPVLELCLQGQRLRVLRDLWLGLTGASPGIPGHGSGWSAFRVRAGEVLEFRPGPAGVWSYLAVPGGWEVERALGSASTLAKAGLGTVPRPGLRLGVVPRTCPSIPDSTAARRVHASEIPSYQDPIRVRIWPGPQWESFTPEDRAAFTRVDWTVSPQSDRSGYRLSGPVLTPDPAEILSEPVLPGSIQVPAGGQPIVTMPDGPTVGGYPKIAVVDPADLWAVAQCRPGRSLRFVMAKR